MKWPLTAVLLSIAFCLMSTSAAWSDQDGTGESGSVTTTNDAVGQISSSITESNQAAATSTKPDGTSEAMTPDADAEVQEVFVYADDQSLPEVQDGMSRTIYPFSADGKPIRVNVMNGSTDQTFIFGPFQNPNILIIDHMNDCWYRIIIEQQDDQSGKWAEFFSTWIMSGS